MALLMMKPPKPFRHNSKDENEMQHTSIIEENIPPESHREEGTPPRFHQKFEISRAEEVDETYAEILNKYSQQQQNPFSLATRKQQSSTKVLVPPVNGNGVPIFKKQVSNSAVSNDSLHSNLHNIGRRPFSPPIKNILPAPTEAESFLN